MIELFYYKMIDIKIMKNIKQINKVLWLKIGLAFIFVSNLLSGLLMLGDFIFYLNLIALIWIVIIAFVFWGWNKIVCFLNDKFIEKANCPYYSKEQCPYGNVSDCPYNISGCYAFSKSQKSQKKSYWLFSFVVIAILIIVISVLCGESEQDVNANINVNDLIWSKLDAKSILNVLQTISVSFIGAVCVAYLFDIPGRMAEYQNYFINLLSSSDYLKKMEEKDLLELRSRITWLLHIKDVPNMPKGLINLDKKICKMLKEPYFKEYTQIVNLTKKDSDKGIIHKKISVEYIAFNPYNDQHPVVMDIGLANSVKFVNGINTEEAKKLFKLTEFTIYIDSEGKKYDLMSHIEIKVAAENEAGLLYNGKILLAPRENESNKDAPLSIFSLNNDEKKRKKEENTTDVIYNKIAVSSQAGLFVKFADKIKVKLQYEIDVPEDDVCLTKRLRYPVKYFHLDYNLGEGFDGYVLVGQLIGTLIDQQNVTVETFENDRHLCLKTHSWLLPKNGAVIVHCKTNEHEKEVIKKVNRKQNNEQKVSSNN